MRNISICNDTSYTLSLRVYVCVCDEKPKSHYKLHMSIFSVINYMFGLTNCTNEEIKEKPTATTTSAAANVKMQQQSDSYRLPSATAVISNVNTTRAHNLWF